MIAARLARVALGAGMFRVWCGAWETPAHASLLLLPAALIGLQRDLTRKLDIYLFVCPPEIR